MKARRLMGEHAQEAADRTLVVSDLAWKCVSVSLLATTKIIHVLMAILIGGGQYIHEVQYSKVRLVVMPL